MTVTARRAIVAVLIIVAFVSGSVLGHRLTFRWMMESLVTQTRGNLAQRVETLARLRTGDLEGGITYLEESVDRAIVALQRGRPTSELSEGVRFSLMTAKVYREVYPPEDAASPVVEILSTFPLPDVQHCSPALQKLLDQAQRADSEPQ